MTNYKVLLTNVGNPDYQQNPYRLVKGTIAKMVCVNTLEEAVVACRDYIEMFGLGGGNWAGGKVLNKKTNEQVAYISYNGRVWEPNLDNEIMVDQTVISELLKKETYYHVTSLSNMNSIYDNGLLPSIGERSNKLGETKPAVYLFKSLTDCEDAITGWLGEQFDENEKMVVIELNLPRYIHVELSGFEAIVKQTIPTRYLRLHQFV